MNAQVEYLKVNQEISIAEVVSNHADLVRRIAHHLVARLPSGVDVDDLIQSGMIGLIEAAKQYNGDLGASFETFATFRVRGSMIDELRKSDWTPRSVHRRVRDAAAAVQEIEQRTGRTALPQEVAGALGIKQDEYYQLMENAARGQVLSLDEAMEGGEPKYDPQTYEKSPEQCFDGDEFQLQLIQALDGLPERERLVMALYYQEEMNLREIGAVLGITESRVCQIHGQALVRVRARLNSWIDPELPG